MQLRCLFDPLLMSDAEEDTTTTTLPTYKEARLRAGQVPPKLSYLQALAPYASVSRPLLQSCDADIQSNQGTMMVTTNFEPLSSEADSDTQEVWPRLFALGTDEFDVISFLECLAHEEVIETDNYVKLPGLHQKLLNNIISRYHEGLVPDLFRYFHSAWATALFHDRFHRFVQDVTTAARENAAINLEEVEGLASQMLELTLQRTDATQEADVVADLEGREREIYDKMIAKVDDKVVSQATKDRFVEYLAFYSYHLPMYARPGLVQ